MCLIISAIFSYLAYSFYMEGNNLNASINAFIAVFFIGLLIRNILKTKKERNNKES